ncbi:MAG: sulfatase-like hydrolase/transferase [Thermoanaerobaculia bacterium]|nr:sulfatase-like hydrolase/transferase [Thermoanaerobaculia bacterium]
MLRMWQEERSRVPSALRQLFLVVLISIVLSGSWGSPASSSPPDVLLVTLDTTRADALGCYRNGGDDDAQSTPQLDALARSGLRFERAITASPLTLPAHASLLTGLTPPEHGIHDNGIAVLGEETPTLATLLRDRGYATAAVVGSRVLDRRFGLDRGFDLYDDTMAAEHVGEYGYPERNAEAVTDAAIDWLEKQARPAKSTPMFLWVHYYDPHAPYEAPGDGPGDATARYRAEVQYVDQQIGRLLAAMPNRPRIVAAVGDHGEALGAHGEAAHGLLLHEPTLRVPLILSGPGVPKGEVVEGLVGSRRLAATLLQLTGADAKILGTPLPGIGKTAAKAIDDAVYSETHLPFTAYGWSVLESMTEGSFRLVVGARAELFDLDADPGEDRNVVDEKRREVRRLQGELASFHRAAVARKSSAPIQDPELDAALRSLGYLSGSSGRGPGQPDPKRIDPKAGLELLEELETAKEMLRFGNVQDALPRLEALAERNPENVPLLSHLARARLAFAQAHGESYELGLKAYRQALELNPRLEFLHLGLAGAYRQLNRLPEAEEAYRAALAIDPRNAEAWFGLAEIAYGSGRPAEERKRLEAAVAAEAESSALLVRLAQLEAGDATPEAIIRSGTHLRRATELTPEWSTPWLLLGRWELDHGSKEAGREALQQVIRASPNSREAGQARSWLAE